jgi:hypothetical protein
VEIVLSSIQGKIPTKKVVIKNRKMSKRAIKNWRMSKRVIQSDLSDEGERGQQLTNHADNDAHLKMFEDEYDLFDNGDLVLVSSKVIKVDRYGNEVP